MQFAPARARIDALTLGAARACARCGLTNRSTQPRPVGPQSRCRVGSACSFPRGRLNGPSRSSILAAVPWREPGDSCHSLPATAQIPLAETQLCVDSSGVSRFLFLCGADDRRPCSAPIGSRSRRTRTPSGRETQPPVPGGALRVLRARSRWAHSREALAELRCEALHSARAGAVANCDRGSRKGARSRWLQARTTRIAHGRSIETFP